jgi:hypothetical protein
MQVQQVKVHVRCVLREHLQRQQVQKSVPIVQQVHLHQVLEVLFVSLVQLENFQEQLLQHAQIVLLVLFHRHLVQEYVQHVLWVPIVLQGLLHV